VPVKLCSATPLLKSARPKKFITSVSLRMRKKTNVRLRLSKSPSANRTRMLNNVCQEIIRSATSSSKIPPRNACSPKLWNSACLRVSMCMMISLKKAITITRPLPLRSLSSSGSRSLVRGFSLRTVILPSPQVAKAKVVRVSS